MSTEGNLRKSKRQPVPNPIYSQGISELKKESNIRHKKKIKANDDDLPSYSEEKNQVYDYYSPQISLPVQSKEPFLPCILPKGPAMTVQFIVQSKPKEEQKKREVKSSIIPLAQKPKKQSNLLTLFQQAIQDADNPNNMSDEENSIKPCAFEEEPKSKPIQRPHRVREENQGSIQNVNIKDGIMQINHSVLGEVKVPVEWKENSRMEEENQDAETLQLRKKLLTCNILKNISILMT